MTNWLVNTYDAAGERTLKLTGNFEEMNINGQYNINAYNLNTYTLYTSPYMVIDPKAKGYTKHYYIESDRFVSKIGGGMANINYNIRHDHVYGMDINDPSDYDHKSYHLFEEDGMMPRHFDIIDVHAEVIKDYDFRQISKFQEYDEVEKHFFFYHKDHLGSSTQISNIDANIIHHIEYMPSGEQFSEQHCSMPLPYKFNGKELDAETGLYYYGARYYTPEIGIWLSVDPLSDKYPSLSPYAYCALNPVILIDPDGREIWITGDGAGEAFNQLSNQVKNITLSMNSDGKLEYKGKAKTKQERLMVKAMEDKKIKVNIKTICNESIDAEHTISEGGGSFFGNNVNKENGQVKSVEATQYVNPEITAYWDTKSGDRVTGGLMLHEVAEAYYGGKIALKNGKSSPPAGYEGTSFNQAHKAASKISKGALIRTEIDVHLPGISITSRNILHPSQSRYISGDNMNGSFTRKR